MFLYKQVNLPISGEIRGCLQYIYGLGWYKSIVVTAKIGYLILFL